MSDSRSLRELALAHKQRVVEVWAEVMNDPMQPGTARIAAADKLADRIEGKPVQKTDMNATIRRTVTDFHDADLIAIAGDDGGESGTDEAEGGEG